MTLSNICPSARDISTDFLQVTETHTHSDTQDVVGLGGLLTHLSPLALLFLSEVLNVAMLNWQLMTALS